MPTLFAEVAVRAALVAAATACILWALRIRAAALRHAAWTAVVVAMLVLPLWSAAGPSIRLAVLPAGAVAFESGSGTDPDPWDAAPGVTPRQPGPSLRVATAPPVSDSSRAVVALAAVYLLGVLTLLARLAIGTVQAHRLRRGAVGRDGRATSARCATPITVGWLSPALILPEGWEDWPPARLDAVVTHEGEHARRRDPLVQWLALFNRAIFWFHPLAWWLERRLASLAEEVCDAAVIRAGHSPQDYSDYLLEMARALKQQGRRVDVMGMAMPGNNLAHRMRQILEEGPMKPVPRTQAALILAFCVTASVVGAAAVLVPRQAAVAEPQAPATAVVRTADIPLEARQPAPLPQPPSPPRPRENPQPPPVATPARQAPAPVERPDFSGHWTFVSSTTRADGVRGGTPPGRDPSEEVKTTSRWLSLGAVNCGLECTFAQDGNRLTITLAPDQPNVPQFAVPIAVLNLDGGDSALTPMGGPPFVVHANWAGNTLIVTHVWAYMTITQRLSIEDGKLKVVNDTGVGYPMVTFTYARQ